MQILCNKNRKKTIQLSGHISKVHDITADKDKYTWAVCNGFLKYSAPTHASNSYTKTEIRSVVPGQHCLRQNRQIKREKKIGRTHTTHTHIYIYIYIYLYIYIDIDIYIYI